MNTDKVEKSVVCKLYFWQLRKKAVFVKKITVQKG